MPADTLQEAYRLIRDGNKRDAVRLLLPIARADPSNADAWWLLANALEDPDKQRRAVERVLKLRPDDARARKLHTSLLPVIDDPFADLDFDDFDSTSQPIGAPIGATTFGDEFPPGAYVPLDEADPTHPIDEFPAVDAYQPFDDVPSGRVPKGKARVPQSTVRVRRSGASPITLVLAAIGLITVLSCGLCVVASLVSFPTIQRVAGDLIQTVTYQPGFATLMQFATSAPGADGNSALNDPLPSSLNPRGIAEIGQTVSATVDTFTDDAWTFSGEANQSVIITLNATDSGLDPQLYLYDSDNREIAANDDISTQDNRNARIEITLPYAGTYTVRVSAFGEGGAYQLTLSRG